MRNLSFPPRVVRIASIPLGLCRLKSSIISGSPNPAAIRPTDGLTTTLVLAVLAFTCIVAPAALVVNEVCFDNSALADETGNSSSDWIELYNSGPGPLNVQNYAVGDANPYEEAKGVRLPNYTIPPGGYLVVFANANLPEHTAWTNAPNRDLIPANSTWRYSVGAAAPAGDWKSLSFNDGAWASGMAPLGYNDATLNMDCATVLDYGSNPANRQPTAYFRQSFKVINPAVITNLLLRARANDGMVVYLNGTETFRQNIPAGVVTHATLASMPVPSTLWTTNLLGAAGLVSGTNVLVVELHQASLSSADFILDLTLTALIHEQVPIVHGQFGLGKEGENVHLFDQTLMRIHKFDSPGYEIGQNKSYGLATDGSTAPLRVFEKPTPGSPNAAAFEQKYQETLTGQKPAFSIPPGVYAVGQSVTLNTPTAGYRVFYTVDGSDPWNSTNFVYSGNSISVGPATTVTSGLSWIRTNPIEITNSVPEAVWKAPVQGVTKAVVLRAIAVSADGKSCSPETSGTYFIGPEFANRTLPLVSLIANTNDLFGFVSGIYVPGKHYADSPEGYGQNRWGKPYANYHQDEEDLWERPLHIEFFEPGEAASAFSQRMGVTMHGGGTRAMPQKALYLLARLGEYGSDRVDYPLFPGEAATSYKRFLLRNSGNDWYGPDYSGVATMIKDAVFHRIVEGIDASVMAYRPAVAYVNGEYWGIHNLRESFDKHYLATRYGLEPDNCDILMHEEDALDNDKVDIERIDGDRNADEEYEAMIDWIDNNPLSLQSNYLQVQNQIDVTNYIDYIVAETFFGNTDWPINNCDFWRAHTNQVASSGKYGDTRWRWMMYDLDVAGAEGPEFNMFDYLSSSKMTGSSEPGFLINKLWANMEFRNSFVTRYVNLLNTTFRPERLQAIIYEAAEAIAPEIERHFRRWGRTHTRQQWEQAVDHALVQYTARRHTVSWDHLNKHFSLGGTGALILKNSNAAGTGGHFEVNGMSIDSITEGVTNRAAWSGMFFRSLPVPARAVPDDGYVFDGWVGTAITNPLVSVFVGNSPVTLQARFRLANTPAYVPTGYEQWQLANYSEPEILTGAAAPGAPSGQAGMSNLQLYVFGMRRNDGLSDAQRQAKTSLAVRNDAGALWLGYTRLNTTFNDVRYLLKTAPTLTAPASWSDAVPGIDLGTTAITNILDASTWYYEVQLPSNTAGQTTRYYRLEVQSE